MPGGSCFSNVCEIAVTCAIAKSIFTFGWKNTRTMPDRRTHVRFQMLDCRTVVVSARSK